MLTTASESARKLRWLRSKSDILFVKRGEGGRGPASPEYNFTCNSGDFRIVSNKNEAMSKISAENFQASKGRRDFTVGDGRQWSEDEYSS